MYSIMCGGSRFSVMRVFADGEIVLHSTSTFVPSSRSTSTSLSTAIFAAP